MLRRIVVILSTLVFGLAILAVSILRAASVRYVFSAQSSASGMKSDAKINYDLVYAGKILPDSLAWPAKVLRDRIWLFITRDPGKQAELTLLLADKRLSASKSLFEKGKPELALTTLTKAEKYLETASNLEKRNRQKGQNTNEFLLRLTNASLKHRQLIEEILTLAPEDARPAIIKTEEYPKTIYREVSEVLLSKQILPPGNPFDRE